MATFDLNKIYKEKGGEYLGKFISQTDRIKVRNPHDPDEFDEKPGDLVFENKTLSYEMRSNIEEATPTDLEREEIKNNPAIMFNKLYDLEVLQEKTNFKKSDLIGKKVVLHRHVKKNATTGTIEKCIIEGTIKNCYLSGSPNILVSLDIGEIGNTFVVYKFGNRLEIENVSFDALEFLDPTKKGGQIKSKRRTATKRKKTSKRSKRTNRR